MVPSVAVSVVKLEWLTERAALVLLEATLADGWTRSDVVVGVVLVATDGVGGASGSLMRCLAAMREEKSRRLPMSRVHCSRGVFERA